MDFDIPNDKNYPPDSVQCDTCSGNGCGTCEDRGWLTPKTNLMGRRCARAACRAPIRPDHVAVYCSNECAAADA